MLLVNAAHVFADLLRGSTGFIYYDVFRASRVTYAVWVTWDIECPLASGEFFVRTIVVHDIIQCTRWLVRACIYWIYISTVYTGYIYTLEYYIIYWPIYVGS